MRPSAAFEPVVTGALWFLLALLAHVVVWRMVRPRREVPWLFLIMLGVPAAAWWAAPSQTRTLSVALALALAYIQTYPAVQARSPSLVILGATRRLAIHGCVTRDMIADAVRADMSLAARFSDLDRERLVERTGDGPRLTRAGWFLAVVFVAYRRIINLGAGAG